MSSTKSSQFFTLGHSNVSIKSFVVEKAHPQNSTVPDIQSLLYTVKSFSGTAFLTDGSFGLPESIIEGIKRGHCFADSLEAKARAGH
jgi:hypothetical protein